MIIEILFTVLVVAIAAIIFYYALSDKTIYTRFEETNFSDNAAASYSDTATTSSPGEKFATVHLVPTEALNVYDSLLVAAASTANDTLNVDLFDERVSVLCKMAYFCETDLEAAQTLLPEYRNFTYAELGDFGIYRDGGVKLETETPYAPFLVAYLIYKISTAGFSSERMKRVASICANRYSNAIFVGSPKPFLALKQGLEFEYNVASDYIDHFTFDAVEEQSEIPNISRILPLLQPKRLSYLKPYSARPEIVDSVNQFTIPGFVTVLDKLYQPAHNNTFRNTSTFNCNYMLGFNLDKDFIVQTVGANMKNLFLHSNNTTRIVYDYPEPLVIFNTRGLKAPVVFIDGFYVVFAPVDFKAGSILKVLIDGTTAYYKVYNDGTLTIDGNVVTIILKPKRLGPYNNAICYTNDIADRITFERRGIKWHGSTLYHIGENSSLVFEPALSGNKTFVVTNLNERVAHVATSEEYSSVNGIGFKRTNETFKVCEVQLN